MNKYYLVVHHQESGDFLNDTFDTPHEEELAKAAYQKQHPDYKVIHMKKGEHPMPSMMSLESVGE